MDKIKIIENFLIKLGVDFETIEKKESDLEDHCRYSINTPDAGVLIGGRGETLAALGHLLKKIIDNNSEGDEENFFIDIGDYQNKKVKDIKNKAIILAERARFFKKDIEMPPMSPYERMIVHSTFSKHSDIETESQGRNHERRVVIRYKKD